MDKTPARGKRSTSPTEQLKRACAEGPDRIAIVTGDRCLSYRGLERLTGQVAGALQGSGVRGGDRVALHLRNSEYLAAAYYACFAMGAIAVPVNIRFKGAEVSHVLHDSGSCFYVGDAELFERIADRPARVTSWVTCGGVRQGARSIEDWLADSPVTEPERFEPDRPAAVLYSSGTTSHPKGITHSQRTLAEAARLGAALFSAADLILIASAMVHAAGLLSLLSSIRLGATCVIVNGAGDTVLDTIERDRTTTMLGLPSLYWAMVNEQETRPRDLQSARHYIVCGDSAPPQLLAAFALQIGHVLRPHYGLTEVFPVTIGDPTAEEAALGHPIDGVLVRIMDDAGAVVRTGDVGELWVQAPSAMPGYWLSRSACAETRFDDWVRTGDLAREALDGQLFFEGRKKDVIVCGGSNVAPAEVENQLRGHPEVADAAVIGVPDAIQGESVAAYVVPRPGRQPRPSVLQAFLIDRLADYKVPKVITIVTDLPRTSTGKLQRSALRDRARV